jgi:hypothetical protein
VLHLLTTASGTKRKSRDDVQFVRFWGKADMHDRLASASWVANDPSRTSTNNFAAMRAWLSLRINSSL